MQPILHIQEVSTRHPSSTSTNTLDVFKTDILHGFAKNPKIISSKYFYDSYGSQLFNQITQHPDYYLTQSELDILTVARHSITPFLGGQDVNLIELGPGEGIKTSLLLEHFLEKKMDFIYTPIDISVQFLEKITQNMHQKYPDIPVQALHADYLHGLNWIQQHSNRCNLILFLGSSIGNYSLPESECFFTQLRQYLKKDDFVLVGFDLRKSPSILIRAYDDTAGITRDFNLNLLQRINRELGADFQIDQFHHQPEYNTHLGAMESYLISQTEQSVFISEVNQTFTFLPDEKIHVESSYKYSLPQIEAFASHAGFCIMENYMDSKQYFIDSFWKAI